MKVIVAIDGGYFKKQLCQKNSPQPDINRMAKKLAGGDELVRAYYYDCLPHLSFNPSEDEKKIYESKERLFHSIQRRGRLEVRHGRTRKLVVRDNRRTTFNEKEQEIIDDLEKLSPWKHDFLREYFGGENNGGVTYRQKRVDCQLTADLVKFAVRGRMDRVALMAGDEDFYPVVETLKDEGVVIDLYHDSYANKDLINLCDSATLVGAGFFTDLLLI